MAARRAARAVTIAAAVYAAACIVALLLIPASAYGWLGVAPDPLAGVFAYLLGMPWTLLVARGGPGLVAAVALTAAAMALNLAILVAIGRRMARS